MYMYMEIIGKLLANVMMSVLNLHLEKLDDYADMPTGRHNLLFIIDIAMPTCLLIRKYQVEVTYVNANMLTC